MFMGKKFNVLIEQGEDGYFIAEVVELPGCRTQAKSYDEILERIKEAISLYISENKLPKTKTKLLSLQQVEVEV